MWTGLMCCTGFCTLYLHALTLKRVAEAQHCISTTSLPLSRFESLNGSDMCKDLGNLKGWSKGGAGGLCTVHLQSWIDIAPFSSRYDLCHLALPECTCLEARARRRHISSSKLRVHTCVSLFAAVRSCRGHVTLTAERTLFYLLRPSDQLGIALRKRIRWAMDVAGHNCTCCKGVSHIRMGRSLHIVQVLYSLARL